MSSTNIKIVKREFRESLEKRQTPAVRPKTERQSRREMFNSVAEWICEWQDGKKAKKQLRYQ